MILQLINSKGRVVFSAEYWNPEEKSKGVDFTHEAGGGFATRPEDIFLSASCTYLDNPSCKVFGTHKVQFKEWCENKDWFNIEFKLGKE